MTSYSGGGAAPPTDCSPGFDAGYILSSVYSPTPEGDPRRTIDRRRQAAVLLSNGAARAFIRTSVPTITPKGVTRLTERNFRYAQIGWEASRFLRFPQRLDSARRFIDHNLLKDGNRLDTRADRDALRLPFAETGGPWRRLPTTYHWDNAAGVHIPAELLNGHSLEKQVAELEQGAWMISRAITRRLTAEELARYSALKEHLL